MECRIVLNQSYIILIILVISMVLFIANVWRFDVVALLSLALAIIVGAVPFSKVYTGLNNPAVITVACVMVLSQSIHQSGVIHSLVTQWLPSYKSTTAYVVIFSSFIALLSAFMNNVGALGLVMPVAIQTALRSKRSPSLILLPIALASALGGLLTAIGTPPNLLISAYRQQTTGQAFSMFDFSHAGIFAAIAGIIFISFIGWRLIPGGRKGSHVSNDLFNIEDYVVELLVPDESPIIDMTVSELEQFLEADYVLLGLIRNKHKRFTLQADQLFSKNDILIMEASPNELKCILQKAKLLLVGTENKSKKILSSHEMATLEAVVSPGSNMEHRSTKAIRLRSRFNINLIAISRQGKSFRKRLHDVLFQAGDVVLLQGPAESLTENAKTLGLLPLVEHNITLIASPMRWLPVIIFALAVILATLQWIPIQIAFGGAVLLLVLFRAIPVRTIYQSIDWPIIILLAAMIPVGEALQFTGGTALISDFIISMSHGLSPVYLIGILFIITMTLSDFMNNAATAVVMAPIAISVANIMHANIDPFLMAVAIACSCSFLTPVGHQNNTIVMGPGGYKFIDYVRIGFPLEVIILLISVPTILWMWPI